MSAPTSPYGSSSGRASIPPNGDRGSSHPSGRAGVPSGGYDGGQRPPGKAYKPRVKPRWGRIALLAGIAVVIIGLIVGISLYSYASNLDQGLKRTDAFSALTGDRPKSLVGGAQNILLLGS
ncbi:MAG TPA: LytR family transcriptional regulator, partial [Actinoplanes sp.]